MMPYAFKPGQSRSRSSESPGPPLARGRATDVLPPGRPDASGQRGNRGAMIRYAFSPSPSRSRSSDNTGSNPVSSRTRSSR
jgi:hypothetical protein